MKTIFDDIGTEVEALIDIFDIPPDHIETAGLEEHRRRREAKAYRDSILSQDMDERSEVDGIIFSMNYPYASLREVLDRAYQQASEGKGKERHGGELPFEDQPMQILSEMLGSDKGLLFQAMKKIVESQRLDKEAAIEELLGAINYLAGAIIYKEQN